MRFRFLIRPFITWVLTLVPIYVLFYYLLLHNSKSIGSGYCSKNNVVEFSNVDFI